MAPGSPIVWVPASASRTTEAKPLLVVLGLWTAGAALAFAVVHYGPAGRVGLLAYGLGAAAFIPGAFLLLASLPFRGQLGIAEEGILLEPHRRAAVAGGATRAYRWTDIRLRGRRLMVPGTRWGVTLSEAHLRRLRSELAHRSATMR